MTKLNKAWLFGALFAASTIGNGWQLWNSQQMKVNMAYWEGIRNVNQVLDCQERPPSAYELVKLRNTNIQSCDDVAAFIGDHNPFKVAIEQGGTPNE